MAIIARDTSVGIDAYMKLVGVSVRETGFFIIENEDEETGEKTYTPTNIKKYSAVLEIECYASSEKVGVYNTKFVPLQGLKQEQCTLEELYKILMSLPEFEGSKMI